MTLVEFIKARLDEDEQWALEASRLHYAGDVVQTGVHWHWVCGRNDEVLTVDPMLGEFLECSDECVSADLRSVEEYETSWSRRGLPQMPIHSSEEVTPAVAGHIARHDPARVLAEVEAKRRIVELHEHSHSCVDANGTDDYVFTDSPPHPYCATLRLLALPYAGHDAYDESWRP